MLIFPRVDKNLCNIELCGCSRLSLATIGHLRFAVQKFSTSGTPQRSQKFLTVALAIHRSSILNNVYLACEISDIDISRAHTKF